ncbi:MAG: hypothetical protein AB7T49_07240 [Oligoflexales bacterium]
MVTQVLSIFKTSFSHKTRWMVVIIIGTVAIWVLVRTVVDPVAFMSTESRTADDGRVFNRVGFTPGWKQDVWMMQQSHSGLGRSYEQWDRLAIVVDKTSYPRVAKFYQFAPGQLAIDRVSQPVPYRAPCFMCHPNGPRAIRPDFASDTLHLSLLDRLKVLVWNLRIKTYGRVAPEPVEENLDQGKPFRFFEPIANAKIEAPTCMRCHNEKWYGRGHLTKQNIYTARFMVANGFMPPLGFSPSAEDLKVLGL